MSAPAKYDYTPERLLAVAPECESFAGVAARLGMPANTLIKHLESRPDLKKELRDAFKFAGPTIRPARTTVVGDDAFFDADPVEIGDADRMLRDRGFNPADWLLRDISMTEWGRDPETGGPYQRLKISLRRRLAMSVLIVPEPVKAVRPPKAKRSKGARLGFIASDFHAPWINRPATTAFLNLLRDVQPTFGVFAGDIADVPEPSRHRRNPGWSCTPKESFGSAYREVLYPTREILPDAEIDVITGNHDTTRIRNFVLDCHPDLLDIPDPSDPDEVGPYSPRRVLGLDSLHMRAIDPVGEYADGRVVLTENLSVIHGEKTGKAAASATLDSYGHSVIFAHTHHKSTSYQTLHDFHGHRVIRALELGCMCLLEGGLGYYRNAKWQTGCGMVSIHDDGAFNFEHVDFIDGSLRWRGERWTP